jgi:hypothetical protein
MAIRIFTSSESPFNVTFFTDNEGVDVYQVSSTGPVEETFAVEAFNTELDQDEVDQLPNLENTRDRIETEYCILDGVVLPYRTKNTWTTDEEMTRQILRFAHKQGHLT